MSQARPLRRDGTAARALAYAGFWLWSPSGFDWIKTGLQIPVLTRFRHANRYPLRSKTL